MWNDRKAVMRVLVMFICRNVAVTAAYVRATGIHVNELCLRLLS